VNIFTTPVIPVTKHTREYAKYAIVKQVKIAIKPPSNTEPICMKVIYETRIERLLKMSETRTSDKQLNR
jgi:hypothetical protein